MFISVQCIHDDGVDEKKKLTVWEWLLGMYKKPVYRLDEALISTDEIASLQHTKNAPFRWAKRGGQFITTDGILVTLGGDYQVNFTETAETLRMANVPVMSYNPQLQGLVSFLLTVATRLWPTPTARSESPSTSERPAP